MVLVAGAAALFALPGQESAVLLLKASGEEKQQELEEEEEEDDDDDDEDDEDEDEEDEATTTEANEQAAREPLELKLVPWPESDEPQESNCCELACFLRAARFKFAFEGLLNKAAAVGDCCSSARSPREPLIISPANVTSSAILFWPSSFILSRSFAGLSSSAALSNLRLAMDFSIL